MRYRSPWPQPMPTRSASLPNRNGGQALIMGSPCDQIYRFGCLDLSGDRPHLTFVTRRPGSLAQRAEPLLAAAFQFLAERSYCEIWVRLCGVALVLVTVVKQ
jgi:hypothetical protein